MGYYTNLIECDFFLDKKHFDDVYQEMCKLNDYHDLKRGGSYGANTDPDPNERYPKNRWFSWMDYNYPETCKDMFEILQQIGFDITLDNDGNLVNLGYYNKTGNEDYFLSCFAGFVRDGSYITFKGEEEEDYYKFVFENGKMSRYESTVVIHWNHYETYDFGHLSKSDAIAAEWLANYRAEQALKDNS